MEQLHGLFTCDECGASVAADGCAVHLNWHKEINEAFDGSMVLFKKILKDMEQLRSER